MPETDTDAEVQAFILLCPVCSSNLDVEATDGETVECECASCHIEFTVKIDAGIIAASGHFG